jgi:hypothetical protein
MKAGCQAVGYREAPVGGSEGGLWPTPSKELKPSVLNQEEPNPPTTTSVLGSGCSESSFELTAAPAIVCFLIDI